MELHVSWEDLVLELLGIVFHHIWVLGDNARQALDLKETSLFDGWDHELVGDCLYDFVPETVVPSFRELFVLVPDCFGGHWALVGVGMAGDETIEDSSSPFLGMEVVEFRGSLILGLFDIGLKLRVSGSRNSQDQIHPVAQHRPHIMANFIMHCLPDNLQR